MKVYLEMTRQVGKNAVPSILGTGVASIMIFLVLEDRVPSQLMSLWVAAQVLLLGARFYFANIFNYLDEEDERWERAVNHFTWAMFFIGMGWGMASVLTALYGTLLHQVVILAILLGVVGAAIGTVAQVLSAYTLFLCSTMSLQIFSFLMHAQKEHMMLGLLTIVYSVVVYRAGFTLAANIRDLVDVRENLARAKKIAEEANMAKAQFLSSMSHELRTPLNAVLGFTQLLEHDKLSPAHTDYVAEISKAGKHLLALISDILALSKIEVGKINIETKAVFVNDVIAECKALTLAMAEKDNIHLSFDMQNKNPQIVADSTRLKQVLVNFISNAIKYNVSDGSVNVSYQQLDNSLCRIRVSDTGNGIPPARQSQLFEPFNRLGRESGTIEGSGIGLVLSKQLAEQMGGRIDFKSNPGEGCEFWVDMPLAASEQETTVNH